MRSAVVKKRSRHGVVTNRHCSMPRDTEDSSRAAEWRVRRSSDQQREHTYRRRSDANNGNNQRHRHRDGARSRSRSRSKDYHRRDREFSSRHGRRYSDSDEEANPHHRRKQSPSQHSFRRRDHVDNESFRPSRWENAARERSSKISADQEPSECFSASAVHQEEKDSRVETENGTNHGSELPSGNIYGPADDDEAAPVEPVEKANFGLTGALAKDERTGNMVNGVVLKCSEPLDASMPQRRWRLYVFKDDALLETLHIHRKSFYLLGRDKRVCDILLLHPSCSSQHAVIQFRTKRVRGSAASGGHISEVVLPYILDLASTHHTFVNGLDLEDSRYVELREKDCLRFGLSSREYVLMCEDSTADD